MADVLAVYHRTRSSPHRHRVAIVDEKRAYEATDPDEREQHQSEHRDFTFVSANSRTLFAGVRQQTRTDSLVPRELEPCTGHDAVTRPAQQIHAFQEGSMKPVLRSFIFPLGLVLLLSLSDCISFGQSLLDDDDSDQSAAPAATSTPVATPSPTPTPRVPATPTPEVPEEAGSPMAEAELEELLIVSADLSPEWSTVDIGNSPTTVPGAEGIDGTLVSTFYQQSELGPFLAHMLLYAEDEDSAMTAFDAIEEELDAAEVLDEVTDQVRSWETRAVDFDDLGDETFAFKAIGDTGLIPVEAEMVTTRQGQYVSFIIYAELMMVDSSRTTEFASLAVERIPDQEEDAELADASGGNDRMPRE